MEKQKNKFNFISCIVSKGAWRMLPIIIIVGIIIITTVIYCSRDNSMSIGQDDHINITPTQIRSIENIGEWEFLSISDEELTDTVRHGFFGDDELVRVYYGTLRLGIDLHDAKPGWIKAQGDSIHVLLPPIKLLDNDFIDEARTQSFFEDGKWTGKDREDLYNRAYARMKQRCLNKQNINTAEDNACGQFYKLLRSMGYENVIIRFDNTKTQL